MKTLIKISAGLFATVGLVFFVLIQSGCGSAANAQGALGAPAPTQTTTAPPTGETIVTPAPSSTPSPTPSTSPAPPTVVTYNYTNAVEICPALQAWNPATTTIVINYPATFYTFTASEITQTTISNHLAFLAEDTLYIGGEADAGDFVCWVSFSSGQITGADYEGQ